MKYQITLEVESDWELDRLIKDHYGALLIGADHPWKVLEAYEKPSHTNCSYCESGIVEYHQEEVK